MILISGAEIFKRGMIHPTSLDVHYWLYVRYEKRLNPAFAESINRSTIAPTRRRRISRETRRPKVYKILPPPSSKPIERLVLRETNDNSDFIELALRPS